MDSPRDEEHLAWHPRSKSKSKSKSKKASNVLHDRMSASHALNNPECATV